MAIVMQDPASHVAKTFVKAEEAITAIRDYGFIPIRRSGEAMLAEWTDGSYRLDGVPLESYFQPEGRVFRFILKTVYPDGVRYDTGASYFGCLPANKEACQPKQYGTLEDAINDALVNNEIPVEVYSEQEAWAMALGQQEIPSGRILGGPKAGMNWGWLAAAGIGLFLLIPRRRGVTV